MKVSRVSINVVEIPQKAPVAPYRSRLRTSQTTRSAIVRVETDEGITGWGEHNVNFLNGVSAGEMEEQSNLWLVGRDPRNINRYHLECPFETRLKSGVEMALWDIRGKASGLRLADLLGGIVRSEVELAACMGIETYDRAGEIASYYVQQGFTTLKTKAGSDMREDLDMVRGIRDAVGDKLQLRIDANEGYSRQQAAELAQQLEPFDLQYFEQPVPARPLADAAWLRQQTKTPVALNESVTDPASAVQIIREEAADFVLPDTHIAGGILPCVTIGRIAEAAGMPCIMHCGHDLGPKTAAMVHIAAACSAYSLANDSTYYGLQDDIITEPLQIDQGRIDVPEKPGLGVEGDAEKIECYKVR